MGESQGRRVRITDVAGALSLSIGTVSMALRGNAKVSQSTRARVVAEARRQGYRPDAVAQALRSGSGVFYESVARVRVAPLREHFEIAIPVAVPALEEDARERGYPIQAVDLLVPEGREDKVLTAFAKNLQAQGIRGVLVECLMMPPERFGIEAFGDLTVVWTGGPPSQSGRHTVTFNYDRGVDQVLSELVSRGYQKPGLVLPGPFHRITDGRFLSAFLQRCPERFPSNADPPRWLFEYGDEADAARWVQENGLDVVVAAPGCDLLRALEEAGYKIPETLGFCSLDVTYGGRGDSGVFQPRELILETAYDLLVRQLKSAPGRVRENVISIQIQGIWKEGVTLRGNGSG